MYVSSGESDGSSSLLPPKEHLKTHLGVKFQETIQVTTTTLDSWADDEGIKRIDFLWMDLQGNELNVLKAAHNTLKTCQAICTEVSLIENYEGGPLYSELRSWLDRY